MDYTTIRPYLDQGLVKEQRHPECSALAIFNYTPQCQYAGAWDEVTMACRGLILNTETGEIVGRGFRKFFNLSEHVGKGLPLPAETPIVTQKYDGSLAILFWLHGEAHIATRGSFASIQAQWATRYLRSAMAFMNKHAWDILRDPSVTHLFEVIAPVSQVVVRYDFEGLVHLATLDRATGRDVYPRPLLPYLHTPYELPLGDCDLAAIQARDEANAEGYVALFPESGLRLKAKFAEYCRLHALVTQTSTLTLWEALSNGHDLEEVFVRVPDEFFRWSKHVIAGLQHAQSQWLDDVHKAFNALPTNGDRKTFALEAIRSPFRSALFALFDKKSIDHIAWKAVRPAYERPFSNNQDTSC